MPRPCHPFCSEKRDFMEVNPPRSEGDFYKGYDPSVGLGTAIVLCIFFFVVTIKSCFRYTVRQWRMYHFYKNMEKEQKQDDGPETVTVK